MNEHPIIFSAVMVRAILEGRKTQTRRIVKGLSKRFPFVNLGQYGSRYSGEMNDASSWGWPFAEEGEHMPLAGWMIMCPYGVAGDRLWVRESGWERPPRTLRMLRDGADTWLPYYFDADLDPSDHEQFKEWGFKRRPAIHMPRAACRIELEVTAVRAERLHAITTADCEAEGCGHVMPFSAQQMYQQLWQSLNGIGSWVVNPWVWVIEFKRTRPPG